MATSRWLRDVAVDHGLASRRHRQQSDDHRQGCPNQPRSICSPFTLSVIRSKHGTTRKGETLRPRLGSTFRHSLARAALVLPPFIGITPFAGTIALGISPVVLAETRPGSATLCGQSVTYNLATAAETPEAFRKYLGIWSGNARGTNSANNVDYELLCLAFIVERITADGTVSSIRVGGDTVKLFSSGANYSVKPSVSAWRGAVIGDTLRLDRGQYFQELHLTASHTMEGAYSDPQSTAVARLRKK
jgi:hypothetical protein